MEEVMKRAVVVLAVVLVFVTGTAFAQSSGAITLDMKNGTIDDLMVDILMDQQQYQNKPMSITNVLFGKFTAEVTNIIYRPDSGGNWFQDTNTYRFYDRDYFSAMSDNRFWFWFQSADREGLRLMLSLNGKYLPIVKLNIRGTYLRLRSGTLMYNIFLVTSFDIDGKTYTGTIPDSVGGIRINK
jgi:hypothetical protein